MFSNRKKLKLIAKFSVNRSKRELFRAEFDDKSYNILIEDGKIKSISKEMPIQIEIFPSLQCNINCAYCDRGNEDSILRDFNDIKVLYNNLRGDPDFNLLNFSISGKEPMLYPKVNELISFLHNIKPDEKINFLANGIELNKLSKEHLEKINLFVAIYPHTEKVLQKNKYVVNLFKLKGYRLKTNVFFHEDMESYGTIRNDFDPLSNVFCINAVLICGTKRVYPCCRAHKLEQMYKKEYHFYIDTDNLYKKLKGIIKNTDLCTHCPRMYKDRVIVPVEGLK